MFITVSFSGGVSHKEDVPLEKQSEAASKIVSAFKAVLEENAASGSGSITLGQVNQSFGATSAASL